MDGDRSCLRTNNPWVVVIRIMDEVFPKLILLDWQDGDDQLIRMKGWFCHNNVLLENGNLYQVSFYDHGRLGQHLRDSTADGKPFFIEEALIVLDEVTVDNMKQAIVEAEKQGFFKRLVPLGQ